MRFLSRGSFEFGVVIFVSLAAHAFQLTSHSQTVSDIGIRCGIARGIILKQVTPIYPPEARAKGVQGLVRISVLVSKDGAPEKLTVVSGPPELVSASLDAVRQWRYQPYKLNGRAVSTETSIDIRYMIQSKKPITIAAKRRFFKEDHGTGAWYIVLTPDGRYAITAREHMGVWVEEQGRWRKTGTRIIFTPNRSGKTNYQATEIAYRNHTFLAWEDDSGPSIKVPIEETERNLDQNSVTLPPYVFFQTSATVYQRETKQTYPFHTHPNLNPARPQQRHDCSLVKNLDCAH